MTDIDVSMAAATLGRKGGSVKSPAKSEAAKARNAKRKAEGKPEGGRPRKEAERDYSKMKYSGVKLESGETAYFLDLHGRDISFPRWRIIAYYAAQYAETVFFGSEAEYLAYIAAAAGIVYTDFREFKIDISGRE